MKTITVQLPDEVYEVLEEISERHHKPIELLALEWLAKYGPRPKPQLSESERQAGLDRLRQFAGAHKGNDPHGSDNERIDADLAREYQDNHEPGR